MAVSMVILPGSNCGGFRVMSGSRLRSRWRAAVAFVLCFFLSCKFYLPRFTASQTKKQKQRSQFPIDFVPVTTEIVFPTEARRRRRGERATKEFVSAAAAMQQKITVRNKRGEKLIGVLHETGSRNIVVLCHGFQSSKESKTVVNLAAVFEKEGISAFRFDFSGNGESEGSFVYGNYYGEAEDLRAVIEYFAGVNRLTVAIIGHSKGGNVVLLHASKYHDIGAVVNLSGRYDLRKGIAERMGKNYLERLEKDGYIDVKSRAGDYQVTEESMKDRLSTNMHEACLSIDKGCRVLTVHGSLDKIVPVEDAQEFAKIIPNHQLQIIKRADHGYSSHQEELALAVLRFVKECLQKSDVSK